MPRGKYVLFQVLKVPSHQIRLVWTLRTDFLTTEQKEGRIKDSVAHQSALVKVQVE
jgi:hypothetical protein